MKLPLSVHFDHYGETLVIDAGRRVVSRGLYPSHNKAACAMVRKFNRDWRWVLFGIQPYVSPIQPIVRPRILYTTEEWRLEKKGRA